jgi:hypothetical protein
VYYWRVNRAFILAVTLLMAIGSAEAFDLPPKK